MSKQNFFSTIGLIGIGVGIGYLLWGTQEPKIVSVSQDKAQTIEGVKQAASSLDVTLNKGQTQEVAQQIQTTKKEYTLETTIGELPKRIEAERKQADFTILTDAKNPEKSFDLSNYDSKLPVELNQYNVTAYKKRLRGINYYPKSISDWNSAMVSVDYSIKISKAGKYLGASVAYNLDNDKAYLGIRYEF